MQVFFDFRRPIMHSRKEIKINSPTAWEMFQAEAEFRGKSKPQSESRMS